MISKSDLTTRILPNLYMAVGQGFAATKQKATNCVYSFTSQEYMKQRQRRQTENHNISSKTNPCMHIYTYTSVQAYTHS